MRSIFNGLPRLVGTVLALSVLALCAAPASATPPKAPERVHAVFLGDRLVDVAYNLGFVAEGMSLRCSMWPMCEKLKTASQVLGCPSCIVKKRPKAVPEFLAERGITRVIVEKTPQFCLYMPGANPMNAVPLLGGSGAEIQYVDFSQGVPAAIRRTAELLGVPQRGEELAAGYEKAFEEARAAIPQGGLGRRVVILNGIHQASTGKTFLRVEAPGGYADQYILGPLGCENVGGGLFKGEPTVRRGHVMIRDLGGLAQARPDVIVMTGDVACVQAALARALRTHPGLREVPALRDMAMYGLPQYVDSGVIEYPAVFRRWMEALAP